jgi:putative ABC transport system substrate-binding protein
MSHPGGNVTGITNSASILTEKRLQFATELDSKISRIAVLWYSGSPGHRSLLMSAQRAAEQLHITTMPVEVRSPDDLEQALALVAQQQVGLLPLADGMFNARRASIIAFATMKKLPLVASEQGWVTDGALMSYGVESRDHYRHAASLVDKILKGARPADLPSRNQQYSDSLST